MHGIGEKCTRFWCESPKERDCSEDRHRREEGIRMDLGVTGCGGGVWSGFTWLRIDTDGGLL
jgi:hypothetical protein